MLSRKSMRSIRTKYVISHKVCDLRQILSRYRKIFPLQSQLTLAHSAVEGSIIPKLFHRKPSFRVISRRELTHLLRPAINRLGNFPLTRKGPVTKSLAVIYIFIVVVSGHKSHYRDLGTCCLMTMISIIRLKYLVLVETKHVPARSPPLNIIHHWKNATIYELRGQLQDCIFTLTLLLI